MIGETVTAVGLVLTLVGALLLAVDLRPVMPHRTPRALAARRRGVEEMREVRMKGFVAPPYSHADVAAQQEIVDAQYEKDVVDLQRRLDEEDAAERQDRYLHSTRGLLLVAAGTALQLVALFL